MPRRSTVITLALAVVTLSTTVLLASLRLHRQAQLSDQIQVNWSTWTLACVAAYAGLALIGWWAVARDRARSPGHAQRP
jgi:H+/Cl- antiporter ClcA